MERKEDEVHVNGGVRDVLPLKYLIDDTFSVIEIRVICLHPLNPSYEEIKKKILSVTLRSIILLVNEVLQRDLKIAKLYNNLINEKKSGLIAGKQFLEFYEYISEKLICDTIDFIKENIQKEIDHGLGIAQKVLKNYTQS